MDLARTVLTCTESASELELSDILRGLSVAKLKTLCAELKLKVSGNKAEIIARLVVAGIDKGGVHTEDRSDKAPKGYHMAEFEKIPTWTKDISGLKSFTLRQLVEYLIDSRDKTFDNESMKAFKSLKAYKYFHDGLVRNIWAHSKLDDSEIILRAHVFSSLKAKSTYTVYVCFQSDGGVSAAACKCVAGKGEACSHVAALMFYIEDYIRNAENNGSTLPEDRTPTDQLQQWHVPPKRDISSKRLSDIKFEKASYGKVAKTHATSPLSTPPNVPLNTSRLQEDSALQQLVTSVQCNFPSSGISHFWLATPTSKEPQQNSDLDIDAGLMLLANKQIVMTSTQTGLDETIDMKSEYFKELCHEFKQEQVIDQQLASLKSIHDNNTTVTYGANCTMDV